MLVRRLADEKDPAVLGTEPTLGGFFGGGGPGRSVSVKNGERGRWRQERRSEVQYGNADEWGAVGVGGG